MDPLTAAAVGAAIGAVTPTGGRRDYTPRVLFGRPSQPSARSKKVSSKRRKVTKSAKAFYKHEREQFGAPAGFDTCKRELTHDPTTIISLNAQFMLPYEVTDISKNTTINSRIRDTIFLSGVKVWMNATNISESGLTTILNWALISPKNAATVTSTDTNFFKDYGATRAWNAAATNKTGLSWATAKINLDDFHLFGNGSMTLGSSVEVPSATDDTTYLTSSNNLMNKECLLEKYIPIGRMVTYASTACNERIYFVIWSGRPSAPAGTTSYNDSTNQTEIRLKCVTYFREPEKVKM